MSTERDACATAAASSAEREYIQRLRGEADAVKTCFTHIAFQAMALVTAIVGALAALQIQRGPGVWALLCVVLLLLEVMRIGTHKFATANRIHGFELHVDELMGTSAALGLQPAQWPLTWEQGLAAWRIVHATLFESVHDPDTLRRLSKAPHWFDPVGRADRGRVVYHAGGYLRSVFSASRLLLLGCLAGAGVLAWSGLQGSVASFPWPYVGVAAAALVAGALLARRFVPRPFASFLWSYAEAAPVALVVGLALIWGIWQGSVASLPWPYVEAAAVVLVAVYSLRHLLVQYRKLRSVEEGLLSIHGAAQTWTVVRMALALARRTVARNASKALDTSGTALLAALGAQALSLRGHVAARQAAAEEAEKATSDAAVVVEVGPWLEAGAKVLLTP